MHICIQGHKVLICFNKLNKALKRVERLLSKGNQLGIPTITFILIPPLYSIIL